jgi:hypothetical protein
MSTHEQEREVAPGVFKTLEDMTLDELVSHFRMEDEKARMYGEIETVVRISEAGFDITTIATPGEIREMARAYPNNGEEPGESPPYLNAQRTLDAIRALAAELGVAA